MDESLEGRPVRLGVIGLGRAFMLTRPAFLADPRVSLAAAFDPRSQAREAFEQEFGGTAYADAHDLCRDANLEAVYIASPHELHREHVFMAAKAGKHVLVEKPLAVSMADAKAMVAHCNRAGVHLLVGPSHSYDLPVQLARAIIGSNEFGRPRLINAFNYTDFLYRPRRPEELDTTRGGGVVFSQAVHQIDVVRLLAGGMTRSVTAYTGNWDRFRSAEGAYTAQLEFDDCAACLTYSGYAHFDSDEWMDGVGELGHRKADRYGEARRQLAGLGDLLQEAAAKEARTYGARAQEPAKPEAYEHFGPIIVSCERADLRLSPSGVHIYGDGARRFEACRPLSFSRSEVTEALFLALRKAALPVQTGAWGLASLEICHAILQSAATRKRVRLKHQIGIAGGA